VKALEGVKVSQPTKIDAKATMSQRELDRRIRESPVHRGRKCPSCGHPMMAGPIRPKRGSGDNRLADWYCANCHHVIWANEEAAPPK
jgi:hypothetical protein